MPGARFLECTAQHHSHLGDPIYLWRVLWLPCTSGNGKGGQAVEAAILPARSQVPCSAASTHSLDTAILERASRRSAYLETRAQPSKHGARCTTTRAPRRARWARRSTVAAMSTLMYLQVMHASARRLLGGIARGKHHHRAERARDALNCSLRGLLRFETSLRPLTPRWGGLHAPSVTGCQPHGARWAAPSL